MNNPKFVLFKSTKNNEYYFRLQAANGEPILASEGYTTKQNCENGIDSVKNHAPYDSNYERKDNIGNYTFNLKATNNQVIGRSENYTSSQGRENGIDSVKRNAPIAPVEDLT